MTEQTPKLNAALVAARADINMPAMDSTNPHFNSKFASLKAIINATVPVAAEHGLAVVQELTTIDNGIACTTRLLHESGEEKAFGPLVIRPVKMDPQGEASASTYARRYSLQAVFAIVGDPDDDGNAASESAFSNAAAKTKKRNALLESAKTAEHDYTRKVWDELDNDQRAEVWDSMNRDDQRLVTESLAVTK